MSYASQTGRLATTALLLAALAATPPARAGYAGAQLDVASDRLFRGLTQNNGLSYSARGDYAFDSRAYLGASAANNRYAGDAEFDLYAGYSRALVFRELVAYSLDGGVSANLYTGDGHGPRGQNLDYVETYAGVAVGPASFKVYYAPDYYNFGAPGYRVSGGLKLPLRAGLSLSGSIAWNDGDGVRRLIAARSEDGRGHAYFDYSATLRRELPRGFALNLQAAGTSLDIDGRRFPRVLLGLSKRFDF